MADSIVRLKVDSQEYDAKIKRAAEGIQHYADDCRKAGGTLEHVENETLDFVKALGQMPTVSNDAMQGMRELTRAATSLTIEYRALTDEEKNSPFGKALKGSIDQLISRASLMKDSMADVQREITGMASDTQTFNQIAGAAQLATTGFQTFQGAAKMLGLQLGDNVEVIAKLQAAMAVTNGLTQMQNLLQKESALMIGVVSVQAKAAAVAQSLLAKNTVAATAAAKAFNLVAKANPVGLLVTALGAAVGAFALFSSSSDDATEHTNVFMGKINETKAAVDELNRSLDAYHARQAKEGRPQLDILKDQLQEAEAELNRWKQEISSNTTPTPKADLIVQGKMAEAIANSAIGTTDAKDYYESFAKIAEQEAQAQKKVNDLREKIRQEEELRANAMAGPDINHQTQRELEAQLSILQDMLKDTTLISSQREKIQGVINLTKDALKNFDPKTTKTGGGGGGGSNAPKILTEEQKISALIASLTKEYQDLATSVKTADDAQKAGITERMTAIKGEIQMLQTRSDELKKFADDAKRIEFPTGSLPQLNQQMKELQEAQSKALNAEEWKKYQQAIEQTQLQMDALKGKWTEGMQATFSLKTENPSSPKISDIEADVTFKADDSDVLAKVREIEGITIDEKTLTVTANTAEAYNQVQALIGSIDGTTVEFKTVIDNSAFNQANVDKTVGDFVEKTKTALSNADFGSELYTKLTANLADATAFTNTIQEMVKRGLNMADFPEMQEFWKKVTSGIDIDDTAWDELFEKINENLREIDPTIQIKLDVKEGTISIVNKAAEQTKKSWEGAMHAVQSVGSSLQQIENPAAKVAGIIAQAIANIALAFSMSSIKAAGGGPVAWIAATATGLATMISTIEAIKSATHYAKGGIVPGNDFTDSTPVYVSSGELILNRSQQANIAQQLTDNNSGGGYTAQPYVDAEKIVLGVNNYFNRRGMGEIVTTKRK